MYRPISTVLGLLNIVMNHACNLERQSIHDFLKLVVQLIYVFRVRHDTPTTGNILCLIDLHMRETDQFADDRLYSLDAIGADAIRIYLIGSPFDSIKHNGKRLLIRYLEVCYNNDTFKYISLFETKPKV